MDNTDRILNRLDKFDDRFDIINEKLTKLETSAETREETRKTYGPRILELEKGAEVHKSKLRYGERILTYLMAAYISYTTLPAMIPNKPYVDNWERHQDRVTVEVGGE